VVYSNKQIHLLEPHANRLNNLAREGNIITTKKRAPLNNSENLDKTSFQY